MPKFLNNKGFGLVPVLVLSLFVGLSGLFVYRYYFYANSISNTELSDLQAFSEGINPQVSLDEDSNVLAAITPGTTFNYYLTGNNVRVDMYGNPLFVRQLTFAPNRVRVTLVSNTGVETNRDLALTNISGGKRITFPITATTAKIEFRSVTGIITGDKPGEWSDTPTKNGIQRTVTVCTNPEPEFFICDLKIDSSNISRRMVIKGCGDKLKAAEKEVTANGLLIGKIPTDYKSDTKILFEKIKVAPKNSTASLITYEFTFKRLGGYFNDVYPLLGLFKENSYRHFSKSSPSDSDASPCERMDKVISPTSVSTTSSSRNNLESGQRN